jgi:hypothetical protein
VFARRFVFIVENIVKQWWKSQQPGLYILLEVSDVVDRSALYLPHCGVFWAWVDSGVVEQVTCPCREISRDGGGSPRLPLEPALIPVWVWGVLCV